MAHGNGSGSGRRFDVSEQLFGPGQVGQAVKPGTSSPTSSSKPGPRSGSSGSGAPVWVRFGMATTASGLATWGAGELAPQIPAGGSRDVLREALDQALAYGPTATGLLGGCTACALAWWWRRTRARRRTEHREERKKAPSAADRAAAVAVKLTPGSVLVSVARRTRARVPRRRRPLKSVTVTYPAGALSQDPSRAVAQALAPILGEPVRPQQWHVAAGQVVLEPGPLPEPEPDPPAEAAAEPVRRAEQSLARVIGRDGENVETSVQARHEDGQARDFFLRHETTAKTASDENQRKISSWLSNMLPEARGGRGWKVTVEPHRNGIRFVDQRAMPEKVLHPAMDLRAEFGQTLLLPIGQDEDENPLGFDASPSSMKPHGLVVGPTGTGKTSLIRSVIVAASQHGMETWGADPKRIEMLGFTDWPGFTSLAVDVEAMRSLINAAYREMFDRYQRIEAREVRRSELDPLLFILDEYLILRSMLLFAWRQAGNRGYPPEFELLTNMLALARSARVHLLLGVQRPDAELFDKGARDNLRFRTSLGELSPQGAEMMWDNRQIGTRPTIINGRGVATGRDGQPTDMQAWWTPSLDPHPHSREELSEAERDRVDLLRSMAAVDDGTSSWATTASGLAVPTSATAEQRHNTPKGGAEDAFADVIDEIPARNVPRIELPIRAMLIRNDVPEHVVIENAERDEPDAPVSLDILPEGGHGETVEIDGDERIWILDYDPEATPA